MKKIIILNILTILSVGILAFLIGLNIQKDTNEEELTSRSSMTELTELKEELAARWAVCMLRADDSFEKLKIITCREVSDSTVENCSLSPPLWEILTSTYTEYGERCNMMAGLVGL